MCTQFYRNKKVHKKKYLEHSLPKEATTAAVHSSDKTNATAVTDRLGTQKPEETTQTDKNVPNNSGKLIIEAVIGSRVSSADAAVASGNPHDAAAKAVDTSVGVTTPIDLTDDDTPLTVAHATPTISTAENDSTTKSKQQNGAVKSKPVTDPESDKLMPCASTFNSIDLGTDAKCTRKDKHCDKSVAVVSKENRRNNKRQSLADFCDDSKPKTKKFKFKKTSSQLNCSQKSCNADKVKNDTGVGVNRTVAKRNGIISSGSSVSATAIHTISSDDDDDYAAAFKKQRTRVKSKRKQSKTKQKDVSQRDNTQSTSSDCPTKSNIHLKTRSAAGELSSPVSLNSSCAENATDSFCRRAREIHRRSMQSNAAKVTSSDTTGNSTNKQPFKTDIQLERSLSKIRYTVQRSCAHILSMC